MGPEATLWNWLKRGLKPFGLSAHVRRVENDAMSGDPDVEGCILGTSFVVELKVAERRRADGSFRAVEFRSDQANFARRRHMAGGRAFLLLREGRNHWLVPGRHCVEVHDARHNLTDAMMATWSICPPDSTSHRLWQEMLVSPL